jgi:septation ring formation regulator EzrA
MEKIIFCKVMKETDEAIEREMKKSAMPCVPDFKMDNFFEADSAAEECHEEER